ncbi:hypothetical protein [Nocardia inohanensis]|uniref:hypothetical protein n=1 Tax=Nocardia inohanensis TaxID=209246 RepID=UPI000A8B9930|nr:hypothetical protein [Nocardia inohanensis]
MVTVQLPITERLRAVAAHRVIPLGYALIGSGFVLVAAAQPFALTGVLGLLPVTLFVIALTTGQMIAMPAVRDQISRMSHGRRPGAYFGFFASVGGVGVLVGTIVLGRIIDFAPPASTHAVLPWIVAAALPFAGAIGLRLAIRGFPLEKELDE